MVPSIETLQEWVGRVETLGETISPRVVSEMAATLDSGEGMAEPGTPLPPLWHWAFFPSIRPQAEIGPDGHPTRGGFLPPVPLPRRMWAGSRLTFHRPLIVGEDVTRTSRITDVSLKEGRTGPLVFVRVRHELATDVPLLTEEHDIVYRAAPTPGEAGSPPKPAPAEASWERTIVPDPVLLFRYSAATFNGHRIHYDRSYVTEVEGYPGLIVHGPLTATLLLDLVSRHLPGEDVARFAFRGVSPLFDTHAFTVAGHHDPATREVKLWARGADGFVAMEASATLR